MTLSVNTNNLDFKERVEREILQIGLGDIKSRIILGNEGGLAYTLFSGDFPPNFNLPHKSFAGSYEQINVFKNFFRALENYIKLSRDHAHTFQFELLSIGRINLSDGLAEMGPSISDSLDPNVYIYSLGIGNHSIDSDEEVGRFINMVNGRNKLEGKYEKLVKLKNLLYHL